MSITKKWRRGWLFHAGIVQATTTRKYLSRSRHQRQTNQQTKHTYTYTYTGEQSNTAHSHSTQRVTIPYETGGDDGRKTTTRSRRGRQGSDDNRERSDCLCPRIGMRSGDAGGGWVLHCGEEERTFETRYRNDDRTSRNAQEIKRI